MAFTKKNKIVLLKTLLPDWLDDEWEQLYSVPDGKTGLLALTNFHFELGFCGFHASDRVHWRVYPEVVGNLVNGCGPVANTVRVDEQEQGANDDRYCIRVAVNCTNTAASRPFPPRTRHSSGEPSRSGI